MTTSTAIEGSDAGTRCPICSAPDPSFICQVENQHSATRWIDCFRCESCDLVFVGNQFTDVELGEAYGGLDATSYYEEIGAENRKKMEYAVERLDGMLRSDSRIIDIGTGNGQFVQVLSAAGYTKVSCHEIPGADLSAVADIADSIYSDFDFHSIPSETFDAVTMLDVVEHVPDPQHLFETCRRILKPGGIVYFHTPVVTRTDRLMHRVCRLPVINGVGRAWQRGRTSVFHLRNYSRRSLKRLLDDTRLDMCDLTIKNELSWPVSSYVRIHFVDKFGLPQIVKWGLTPFFYPLLKTDFFNANKSIVVAKRDQERS